MTLPEVICQIEQDEKDGLFFKEQQGLIDILLTVLKDPLNNEFELWRLLNKHYDIKTRYIDAQEVRIVSKKMLDNQQMTELAEMIKPSKGGTK